ncbi:MAG TPA: hypothetical protein VMI30_02605 [Stellaceae bacterium]|nr:hypothetical protein [Stellaceae bacterium]
MTATDAAAERRNQIPRGILYMVISTALFAAINAIVKWELAKYPVGEVRSTGRSSHSSPSRW